MKIEKFYLVSSMNDEWEMKIDCVALPSSLSSTVRTISFCMQMHTIDNYLGVLYMVDDAEQISTCCRRAGG
jgi:hypothetical protein